jgi:hypothetical protein
MNGKPSRKDTFDKKIAKFLHIVEAMISDLACYSKSKTLSQERKVIVM